MALYANGYRLGNGPFKRGLGALTTIYNGAGSVFNHRLPASAMRSSYGLFGAYAAYPVGQLHPTCWMLPQKGGAMSSHNMCFVSLSGTGDGAKGVNLAGAASVTLNASALGGLIAGGVGNATISITGSGAVVATIGTTGSATISIGAVANPGALGWLEGNAPIDISGTLVSYAIGHMSGTTAEAGLTPTGIANQVWAKIIEAGFSAEQILRLLAAHAAGSATGLEGANPQFTGLDGSTVRIDGTYNAGTRTIDALDGD